MVACWSVCQVFPMVTLNNLHVASRTMEIVSKPADPLRFLSSGAWTPSSLSVVFCSRNALVHLWIFRSCLVHFLAWTTLTPLLALGSVLWELGFQVKTQLLLAIKTGRLPREIPSFTALCFFGVTPSRPGSGQLESTHHGTLTGWTAQHFILCECWRHYSQLSISKQLSLLVRRDVPH